MALLFKYWNSRLYFKTKKKMAKYKIITDPKVQKLEGTQKLIVDLASGSRKPKNKKEEALLKEIKAIEKSGRTLDLPFD